MAREPKELLTPALKPKTDLLSDVIGNEQQLYLCIPVILNRGAAEPLGAVKNYRGAANLWIWRLFNCKL